MCFQETQRDTSKNQKNDTIEIKTTNQTPDGEESAAQNTTKHSKIMTKRQLQEKCQDKNVDLYITIATSPKLSTQSVMDYGDSRQHRFIVVVRLFIAGMQARVQNDGEFYEPFQETIGSSWLCYGPRLFSLDDFGHAH